VVAHYNASGKTLHIKPTRPLFQLWLNALGNALPEGKTYPNRHPPDAGIQDDDVADISGMVASPAGLSTRIDGLGDRISGELPKLENSLTKTITDKTHDMALTIEKVNGNLGAKIEGVRTQQILQWFVIAALVLVFVIEPFKACAKSKSDAATATRDKGALAPVVSTDAAIAPIVSIDAVAPVVSFDAAITPAVSVDAADVVPQPQPSAPPPDPTRSTPP
jgi:hypothetical protein